jgi:hypothetical protein
MLIFVTCICGNGFLVKQFLGVMLSQKVCIFFVSYSVTDSQLVSIWPIWAWFIHRAYRCWLFSPGRFLNGYAPSDFNTALKMSWPSIGSKDTSQVGGDGAKCNNKNAVGFFAYSYSIIWDYAANKENSNSEFSHAVTGQPQWEPGERQLLVFTKSVRKEE